MGEASPQTDDGTTRKRRWAWAGGILAAVVTAVLTAFATGLVDRVINPVPPEETEAYQEYQDEVREFCETFDEAFSEVPLIPREIAPGRVYVLPREGSIRHFESTADAYAAAVGPLFDIEPHPALVDEFEQAQAQYQAELDNLVSIKDAVAALGPSPTEADWVGAATGADEPGVGTRTTRAFRALAGEECPLSLAALGIDPPKDPPACLPNASIALAPRSGPSGTRVTVVGTGFPPDTEIQIGDPGPEAAALTDRDGNFEVSFLYETPFDGPATIYASSLGDSCQRSALFDVTN